jgi:hypothetical protein
MAPLPQQPALEVVGVVGVVMALTGGQRLEGLAVPMVEVEAEKEPLGQLGLVALVQFA